MSLPEPSPPAWGTDYFRDASPDRQAGPGLGMIGHVPIIAWLNIVQGLFELLFGLVCIGIGAIVFLIPEEAFSDNRFIAGFYVVIGLPALLCATLRFVAGYSNLRFRRRRLGIAALAVGLFSVMTGFCALTAIALAIYGLVVYVNESVVVAFHLGDQGHNRAEINAKLSGS
jgi:hypothetical protein